MTAAYRLSRRRALALGASALAAGAIGSTTLAQQGAQGRAYRVTVANLTPGQPFTPPAVAAHTPDVEVFAVGERANQPTQSVAENGNLAPLLELLQGNEDVRGAVAGDGPLVPKRDPGGTGLPYYASLTLTGDEEATHMTFLSMLVATNDGIVGLDTVELPEDVNESATYFANGYDVGTERNTERFRDLVPPAKTLIIGGEPEGTDQSNPALEEDSVIRPHPGIRGNGDLPRSVYDWTEPAAVVQVERLADVPDGEPPTNGNETTNGNGTTTGEPTTDANETLNGTVGEPTTT